MNKKGFTLIEMIIAVGILSLVSVIVLRLYVAGSETEDQVDLMEMAALQASNCIEDFKVGIIHEKTLYNDMWLQIKQAEKASYECHLFYEQDPSDDNLYDLEVQVWNLKSTEEIISIKTKVFNPKEKSDDH